MTLVLRNLFCSGVKCGDSGILEMSNSFWARRLSKNNCKASYWVSRCPFEIKWHLSARGQVREGASCLLQPASWSMAFGLALTSLGLTHHYITGNSRRLSSLPIWDFGEGPLWITKGRRQLSVVLQDLRVLWKVSLSGSWHGGYPQPSIAWSNLGSLAIQHFYSFTGKYEPMSTLPLVMTKKTQD